LTTNKKEISDMALNIIPLDSIRAQAEQAAEHDAGPQANHYPDDSPQSKAWLRAYYNMVNEMAIECVA